MELIIIANKESFSSFHRRISLIRSIQHRIAVKNETEVRNDWGCCGPTCLQ